LRLGDVMQILVGDLVREHPAELVVVGLLEKTCGHEELTAAGAGGIDRRIIHDADLDLARIDWLVHALEQRNHDTPQALALRGIELCRRGSRRRGARAGRRAARL
jgi:hypothetical protein